MSYASTLQIADLVGISIQVYDENVGTGDNNNLYFDLDYDNVLASSYTLNHAASGSNNFTALTETTHYTLDVNTGKIVLTATGRTALGTDILYATYKYTEKFSNSLLSTWEGYAEDEVDFLTSKEWGTLFTKTEYFDGRLNPDYPTTDEPYARDWDAPQILNLTYRPITRLNAVYFLSSNQSIGQFFNYDVGTGTYTDYTDEINSPSTTDVSLFATVPAENDAIYIGCSNKFLGLTTNLSTLGTTGIVNWYYYNGTTWASLSVTDINSGASNFTASGRFIWNSPTNWTQTSVNSSANYYFIKGVMSATIYVVAPMSHYFIIEDVITEEVNMKNIKWTSYGRISFTDTQTKNGTQNIRVDYQYGTSTVPNLVTELTCLIAGLRIMTSTAGGNYAAYSSISLGSKSFSTEPRYKVIEEIIKRYQDRIKVILDILGRNVLVGVI
jgi:hypothetical protein